MSFYILEHYIVKKKKDKSVNVKTIKSQNQSKVDNLQSDPNNIPNLNLKSVKYCIVCEHTNIL